MLWMTKDLEKPGWFSNLYFFTSFLCLSMRLVFISEVMSLSVVVN